MSNKSRLFSIGCSQVYKYIAQIILLDNGHQLKEPLCQEHELQIRYHLASCGQCFYQTLRFVKEPRPYCEELFKIMPFVYVTEQVSEHEMPVRPLSLSFTDQQTADISEHINSCEPCKHWFDIIKNSWKKVC